MKMNASKAALVGVALVALGVLPSALPHGLAPNRAEAQQADRSVRSSNARARRARQQRAKAARARKARIARQRRVRQRRAAIAAANEPTPTTESTTVVATTEAARAPAQAEGPISSRGAVPDPASLDSEACLEVLDANSIRYRRAPATDGLELILLEGPIGGVEIAFVGRNRVHSYLDCRVAVAVLAWAPELREAQVKRIRHLSIYRAGATVETTGRRSGHAAALALDVRYIDLEDGRTLDVLVDWGDRTRGASPCPAEEHADDPSPLIRTLVCSAVERDIFETVITPHHDAPHQNHVHVEVVPGVNWRFVR